MKAICRQVMTIIAALLPAITGFSQAVPLEIFSSVYQAIGTDSLQQYARHKVLPSGYEQEALQALSHFPELKKVRIVFRIKKSFSTLSTRPDILSMFMPRGQRAYIITISNNTIPILMPITFANLPEQARIGVLGHELSHVTDFSGKTTWQCWMIAIRHLSPRYLDRFEYGTDAICIRHGLGRELLEWSRFIRNTLHSTFWRGSDNVNRPNPGFERYMNPSTIESRLEARPLPGQ